MGWAPTLTAEARGEPRGTRARRIVMVAIAVALGILVAALVGYVIVIGPAYLD